MPTIHPNKMLVIYEEINKLVIGRLVSLRYETLLVDDDVDGEELCFVVREAVEVVVLVLEFLENLVRLCVVGAQIQHFRRFAALQAADVHYQVHFHGHGASFWWDIGFFHAA